jgi:hypothetical protein
MTKRILILMACAPVALLAQGGAQMGGQVPWLAPRGQAGPIVGKPLSGTETFQRTRALADGTNLNNSGSGKFYRDGQGRMRSESEQFVVVFDPVAGSFYTFMNAAKGYRQIAVPAEAAWSWIGATNNGSGTSMSYDKNMGPGVGPALPGGDGAEPPVTVALPPQTLNGIWATGTRITVNIPAGAAGNSKSVQIVREQWYSADLGVVVQSTTSDPRYGTSSYNLTDVQQGAPDAALFRVPEGYTLIPTPNAGAKK